MKIDISKPFPNEHEAILNQKNNKGKYVRIVNNQSKGIDIIIDKVNPQVHSCVDALLREGRGIRSAYAICVSRFGKSIKGSNVYSLRFDSKKFTAIEARKWLKDNNIKAISFSEASKTKVEKQAYQTSNNNKHFHLVELDDNENGITSPPLESDEPNDKHTHKVENRKVQEADGHTHELTDKIVTTKSSGLLTKEWDFYKGQFKKGEVTIEILKEARKVYQAIEQSNEIHFNEEKMADSERQLYEIMKGDRDVRTVIGNSDMLCDPSLDLDKHPIEARLTIISKSDLDILGLVKYELGYALDISKAKDGENIIKACEIESLDLGLNEKDNVIVFTNEVILDKVDERYGIKLNTAHIKESGDFKPDYGTVVLNNAYQKNILKADKSETELLKELNLIEPTEEENQKDITKEIPIIKSDRLLKEGIVLGVVYEPNQVDLQGDYTTPEEIRKAAHKFMLNHGEINFMHRQKLSEKDVAIVESYLSPVDFTEGGRKIKKDSWIVGLKLFNPNLKKLVREGKINAFSMEGKSKRGKPIPEIERTAA